MCFSGKMAGFFSASGVLMAALQYAAGHPVHLSIAILYFSLMEALQAVQYLSVAVPDDNYMMCGNNTNQFLSYLGMWHIAFQPFFLNMAMFSLGLEGRGTSIKRRYMGDIILRICFFAGVAFICRTHLPLFWPDNPMRAPRGSENCPNYEWVMEGFDGYLRRDTPNIPGQYCTFLPETLSGHLAWAFPGHHHSYLVPCVSIHALLMFAPALAVPALIWPSVLCFLSGPFLASKITTSVNEQAAVWCYNSMFQCLCITLAAFIRRRGLKEEDDDANKETLVEHPGGFGEEPLKYGVETKASIASRLHSNNSSDSISDTSTNESSDPPTDEHSITDTNESSDPPTDEFQPLAISGRGGD